PDPMVDVPGLLRHAQGLTTYHTPPLLFLPQILDPTSTRKRLFQLPGHPCFQVQFPRRIVGVGFAPYLHMGDDAHLGGFHQLNRPALTFPVAQRCREHPILLAHALEVFLLDPRPTLLTVPSSTPMPHHAKDASIHLREGALARRMAMIHGPTLDLLIQA